MKLVIDTNVLVSSLSSQSIYHWLVKQLLDEKFDVFVTDEILLEYEEVLNEKYTSLTAATFIAALKLLPNVHFTQFIFAGNCSPMKMIISLRTALLLQTLIILLPTISIIIFLSR